MFLVEGTVEVQRVGPYPAIVEVVVLRQAVLASSLREFRILLTDRIVIVVAVVETKVGLEGQALHEIYLSVDVTKYTLCGIVVILITLKDSHRVLPVTCTGDL